jgi:hypothetical protein
VQNLLEVGWLPGRHVDKPEKTPGIMPKRAGSNTAPHIDLTRFRQALHSPAGALKVRNFLPIIAIQIHSSEKPQSAASLILLLLIINLGKPRTDRRGGGTCL